MTEQWHTLSAPSPNFTAGTPAGKLVVIHSTRGGAPSMEQELRGTLAWFAKPDNVSAHLVIAFDGTIFRCVDDTNQAWHARELNAYAWSIELVQPTIDHEFSFAQYASLKRALRHYRDAYGVPLEHLTSPGLTGVTGHDTTAPGRRDGKTDPGPKFDWSKALPQDGEIEHSLEIHEEGARTILVHNNIDVLLLGDVEGAFPGRLAKLFGDTYYWLRKADDGSAFWSTEEGD